MTAHLISIFVKRMSLISIVIPAYRAEATLSTAVRSVLAQTLADWECIVVSDDHVDYGAVLESVGIWDSRLRFVSTGRLGSGCHAARNRGLAECCGEIVCALDADDVWMPRRLEVLAPRAIQHGAGVDGPRVKSSSDNSVLYSAFDGRREPFMLDVSELLRLTCPVFPLTRRDVTFERTAGIEHLEDVVSNLLLISSNGPIWATPESLMDYCVLTGSMCHADNSAVQFDRAYANIIARVESGSLFVPTALRPSVIAGLEQKRGLNQRFDAAQRESSELNFQMFAAAQRKSGPGHPVPDSPIT
jgi:glycosyltransferase involved in cell wall biosynthesis